MASPTTLKKGILSILFLLGLLWTGGFVWFVDDAKHPSPVASVCDGIVALTGGQSRIDTSITLLKGGYGQLLLISGVSRHVTLEQLTQAQQQVVSDNLASRITLGHRATSTIGNANEAAEWAYSHHLTSLLVVTAGYHMRRAMIELHRTMPDIHLVPYVVIPPALNNSFSRHTLLLMLKEYLKFLRAELGSVTGLPDGRQGLLSS
ncbi:YdcF family protein [Swingsia samuiensis]|uniref:YdcF family protein n=1 Tax=Swingsia samuiensis TaxID=1293412 RepID=A0A4Y6UH93_9PROT|nr:YdcF family protein [Swingsia samuiensis]QDH16394.1 YdcF family protein [Swingsia samuiensis]